MSLDFSHFLCVRMQLWAKRVWTPWCEPVMLEGSELSKDTKACKPLGCGAGEFIGTFSLLGLSVPRSFVGRLEGAILNSVANVQADQPASLSLS